MKCAITKELRREEIKQERAEQEWEAANARLEEAMQDRKTLIEIFASEFVNWTDDFDFLEDMRDGKPSCGPKLIAAWNKFRERTHDDLVRYYGGKE